MTSEVPAYRVWFSAEEIDEFVARTRAVLASGALVPGANNGELEAAFAALVGVRYATAVSSGTAALEIALRCLDLGGVGVLVPANTNFATAEAVVRAGCRPVLYDADLYPDLASIEAARTPDVAGLVVVHIGGYLAPTLPQIAEFCAAHGIRLVEDASHAHGAAWRGRAAGSFGAAAAFSMFATKVLTTGEGGLLVTDDPGVAGLSRRYRDQGKADDGLHNVVFGSAWRMSELHAALGVVQLPGLPVVLERVNTIVERYAMEISHPLVAVPYDPEVRYSGHKFVVTVAAGQRDELRDHLHAHGVRTAKGVYEVPLHRQPALGLSAGPGYPRAERFAAAHLCLPMWKGLTDGEVDRVVDAVNRWPGRR
ncbi:MAG: DegT/DnrJ/EryC1/StrS family aminotransferase [Actinobacteria bacterium]|nr:DegT/DnrJ/EryC1/StrS family aminotransferase [Actinomycetota bacterium]MBI3688610.1 DegT/DnrJ/EryC1/StrS family aminotransferase [Actinomycetota bacterium]